MALGAVLLSILGKIRRMVVVAVGARQRVRVVLLARRTRMGVHRRAVVVGERRGSRRQRRDLFEGAMARLAGGGVHRLHGHFRSRLVAELHVGMRGRKRVGLGMALDARHALGLVGHALRAGVVKLGSGLRLVAYRAVGLHRPVRRLPVQRRGFRRLVPFGRGRSLLGRAADERPQRCREHKDGAEDGEHGKTPVGDACLRGHALLLSSRLGS